MLISPQGKRRDCVIDIIRRFLLRFPLELGDKEPDVRFLVEMDDDRQLPEPWIPEPHEMPELTPEQYEGMVQATQQFANDMKAKGEVSDACACCARVMCSLPSSSFPL